MASSSSSAAATLAACCVLVALALATRVRQRPRNGTADEGTAAPGKLPRLIFLGAGCSGGTPIALCLLGLVPGRPHTGCAVCQSAHMQPTHKNHRRNPSVLLQNRERTSNALIDCGKTFREAALQWFPKFGVRGISTVLLTHEHADATFGLDELRMVQYISKTSPLRQNPPPPMTAEEFLVGRRQEIRDLVGRVIANTSDSSQALPNPNDGVESRLSRTTTKSHPLGGMYDDVTIHCMDRTEQSISSAFPYLVSKGKGAVPRFVSQLSFAPFELNLKSRIYIKDFFGPDAHMEVIPLPVEHGADFMCAGFQFGRNDIVVYISDVSKIPADTLLHLRSLPRVRLFVVDALRPVNYEKHTRPMVHFDLEDALNSIRALGKPPVQTLLVGLGHEFDYDSTNEMLKSLPADIFGRVECAYDGLCIELDL